MMSCYMVMGFSLTWIILYLTNQSASQHQELLLVLFAFYNKVDCRFVFGKCIKTMNKEIFYNYVSRFVQSIFMKALIHSYYNLNKERKTLVSSPVTNTSKRRKDHDRRPWQFYGPISMIWLAEIGQLCVVTNGADKSCFGLIVNPYANNKTCSIVWVFSLIATNVARANTRRVLFFLLFARCMQLC